MPVGANVHPRCGLPGSDKLPLAPHQVAGWRASCLVLSRLHEAEEILALFCQRLVARGCLDMARLLLLILIFYLRPSESFRLTVGHFTPPLITRGSRLYRWSLVLHRFEDEVPSKVGAFDETLLLDLEEHQWFGRVLEKWLADRPPHELLVNFTQRQNSQKIREIAGEIYIGPKPTLYQLHQSVVSLDLALGRRTRKEPKARGPRALDSSRQWYTNGGRLVERFKRLSLNSQPEGVVAFNRLPALLTGR